MFYTDKKVLVTGGSGFVGTAIVKQLLESGAHVRIPVRNRKPVIVHPNIETMPGLLRPPRLMRRIRCRQSPAILF
jgi:nucleoside-diphosphate-sugar epimerase